MDAQGPDVLNAIVKTFMQFETTLLRQVRNQVASAMPTQFGPVPEEEAKPHLLTVDVKYYFGKEGGNVTL